MSRILAVGGDPGGAAALAPVLRALLEDPSHRTRVLAYRQALDVWGQCRIPAEALPAEAPVDPAAWVGGERPDLLLTSTSVNGVDHERGFLRWAAGQAVPSVSVLDFWTNYRARFRDGNGPGLLLPTAVAVMDQRAKEEMLAIGFPPQRIEVTGQPAFDDIHAFRTGWTESRRRHARRAFRAGPGCRIVLFVSQPLSQLSAFGEGSGPTLDEHALLGAVAEALEQIAMRSGQPILLAVRPHPRQKLGPADLPHGSRIRCVLAPSIDRWPSVLAADLVVGITSVLLAEACLLGCMVVSIQPGSERNNPLPTSRSTGIVAVYDLAALRDTLQDCLVNVQRLDRPGATGTEWAPAGATARVLALIDRILREGARDA